MSFNNLTWPVLNPSIRLSWIRQHWEPHYVTKAIETIKKVVSLSVRHGDSILIYLSQMRKYHARLSGQTQQPTPDTAGSKQKWHDLAGQYGLEDMMNVSRTTSELGEGIEGEFKSYGDGPLSPRGTDLVGFWAVSAMSHYSLICHYCFVCR